MPIFSEFDGSAEMWAYLGFDPWEHRGAPPDGNIFLRGAARRITLVKSGPIGVVAKYYAWDYVVWAYQDAARSADYLLRRWLPIPDTVTQRFLLVGASCPLRKAKSFWLGLKGFLEIYAYTPGEKYHPKIGDLVPPVEQVWSRERKRAEGERSPADRACFAE